MGTGSESNTIPYLGYVNLYYAQLMARGTNNKNSVTRLKLLSDKAQQLADINFVIGINQISSVIPDKFTLQQNYPNPFNPETKIRFEVPQTDFVKLIVYDLSGKIVEELVNEKLSSGAYEVNFSAKNISSGIYFYQIKTSSFTETKRMILIK